jgi:hypothetical protein
MKSWTTKLPQRRRGKETRIEVYLLFSGAFLAFLWLTVSVYEGEKVLVVV